MNQPIATYWIPRWVLERSAVLLRQDGLKGTESTLLWGGRRFGTDAVVMAVLYPCGHDVEFDRNYLRVGPDTTAEMGRWLRAQGLRGLIQVHTHPAGWTGHSKTDDDFPIASSDGFISLVWPHFAQDVPRSIHAFGIHQLRSGTWHLVEGEEATALLRVVESEGMIWAPLPAHV